MRLNFIDGTTKVVRGYSLIVEDLETRAIVGWEVFPASLFRENVGVMVRRVLAKLVERGPIVLEVSDDRALRGIPLDAVANEVAASLVPGPSTLQRNAAERARRSDPAVMASVGTR